MESSSDNGESYKGMSVDNIKGLVLAISSSFFIGASFIVKKKGLKKAGATGTGAVVVGEVANFAAYAFAPAILVTPLGALSIIISAVLAHIILNEKLHIFGMLGCVLCVVGSTTIVLHAPPEREIESVTEVMSVKALGIALKLTLSGMNQLVYPQTWAFAMIVAACVVTQMNYLNKKLNIQVEPFPLPLVEVEPSATGLFYHGSSSNVKVNTEQKGAHKASTTARDPDSSSQEAAHLRRDK
ncbi:hypothetical protein Cgig2_023747 [Carnegiea gigantea]|uniref:Probable magnesium transporter n=1 Tax=Carnegiea gigantea TaxID=171969 RepID=A0A9Q1KET4_9CARY|nr:hypothetical protein Cgig2_023747 [Carnegiea gigantea]